MGKVAIVCLAVIVSLFVIGIIIAAIVSSSIVYLGVIGIIFSIISLLLGWKYQKNNNSLFWPLNGAIFSLILAIFSFSLGDGLSGLALTGLFLSGYLFILTFVFLFKKRAVWKKILGSSIALFIISMVLIINSPTIETVETTGSVDEMNSNEKVDTTNIKNDDQKKTKDEEKAKEQELAQKKEEEAKKKAEEEAAAKEKAEKEALAKKKAEEEAAAKEKAEKEALAKKKAKEEALAKEKEKEKAEKQDKETVTLTKTVDGDTIKVIYEGKEETVRYLLVDTPESKDPGSCVQPFAEDATNRNKQLVNSGKLTLEFDNGDKKDRYGRLLAYVFVDGNSVQETLLKEGYAQVAYIYEPEYKYLNSYESAENVAESQGLNIWSKSGFVVKDGFNGCVTSTANNSSSSSDNNSNDKTPKSDNGGPEYFANCTELRTKYPNGVPSTHPAYQSKMDRDKDNFACER